MDGAQGYGVRIRQPQEAGDDWAADLSLMISPIIGEDPESLEDALGAGEVVVAVGLPFDEAKQLVAVFQSLGAEAEVVDRVVASDAPSSRSPVDGSKPSPVAGTQPFNMAGLRKALEAAARSAPPLGMPADGDLPPVPPVDDGGIQDGSATRPFDPALVRAALARVGDGPDPVDVLPALLGSGGDEDDIPTSIKAPGGAPGYASGLMGVIDDEEGMPTPGRTQSFGGAMYEPPPPPPGDDPFDGPPPPDRGALAGFAAQNEQFDPDSARLLREGRRRRGFASGPVDLLDGPPPPDFDAPPRRGAAIGDKPTDRLLMPPGVDPSLGLSPSMDPGLAPPPPVRGEIDALPLPPLSRPDRLPLDMLDPPTLARNKGAPMIVQLDAPVVDPSETGTFTREASLDPLVDDDVETRQVNAITDADLEAELRSESRKANASSRGVRPGVYQLDRDRRVSGDRPGMPAAGAAILSTGQMVARPIARPDEEVTDSGSFRIVDRKQGEDAPRIAHSPLLAGFLSLILPGMGQVYNGQRDRGIIFALAWLAVLPWVYAVIDAILYAQSIRSGRRPPPDPKIFERGRWGQLLLNVAVIFTVVVGYTIWTGMQPPPMAPAPAAPAPAAAPAPPPGG